MNKTIDCLKNIIFLIMYFIVPSILIYLIKKILTVSMLSNIKNIALIEFGLDLFLALLFVIIYFKGIKKDIKRSIKVDELIKDVVMIFLIKIFLGIIISVVSSLIGLDTSVSNNQALVEKLMKALPLYMIISSVIFAPVVEELVFRFGVNKIFKNKKVFVLVSGLIFGFMHVTDNLLFLFLILLIGITIDNIKDKKMSVTIISLLIIIFISSMYMIKGDLLIYIKSLDYSELINSISYIAIGLYLAYTYFKNDNIIHNILIHSANNFISIILFAITLFI